MYKFTSPDRSSGRPPMSCKPQNELLICESGRPLANLTTFSSRPLANFFFSDRPLDLPVSGVATNIKA